MFNKNFLPKNLNLIAAFAISSVVLSSTSSWAMENLMELDENGDNTTKSQKRTYPSFEGQEDFANKKFCKDKIPESEFEMTVESTLPILPGQTTLMNLTDESLFQIMLEPGAAVLSLVSKHFQEVSQGRFKTFMLVTLENLEKSYISPQGNSFISHIKIIHSAKPRKIVIDLEKHDNEVFNRKLEITKEIEKKIGNLFIIYPSLKSLDLTYMFWLQNKLPNFMATVIDSNSALTSLNLSQISFGIPGIESIAKTLQINTTLTDLNLAHTQMAWHAIKPIAEVLPFNNYLKKLDFTYNKLGDPGINLLCEGLKNNCSLTSLNLNYCIPSPSDFAGKKILEFLKNNTTLTSLSLSGNHMGTEGYMNGCGYSFGAGLMKIPTLSLTSLDMSDNRLGSDANGLIWSLRNRNFPLRILNLSGNEITNTEAEKIAEALKCNTNLTELYLDSESLRRNDITDAGAKKFADTLLKNTNEEPKYFYNPFRTNTTLKVLSLKGNKIGEEGKKALDEVCKENKNIKILM